VHVRIIVSPGVGGGHDIPDFGMRSWLDPERKSTLSEEMQEWRQGNRAL